MLLYQILSYTTQLHMENDKKVMQKKINFKKISIRGK